MLVSRKNRRLPLAATLVVRATRLEQVVVHSPSESVFAVDQDCGRTAETSRFGLLNCLDALSLEDGGCSHGMNRLPGAIPRHRPVAAAPEVELRHVHADILLGAGMTLLRLDPGPISGAAGRTGGHGLRQPSASDQQRCGGSTRAQRGPPSAPVRPTEATNPPSPSSAALMSSRGARFNISFARRNISNSPASSTFPQVKYRNRSPGLPFTADPRKSIVPLLSMTSTAMSQRASLALPGTRSTGMRPTWTATCTFSSAEPSSRHHLRPGRSRPTILMRTVSILSLRFRFRRTVSAPAPTAGSLVPAPFASG